MQLNKQRKRSKVSRLEDEIISKLEASSLCQLLYLSYLKMGNNGSFREFANECWRCYTRDTV